jgi:hypothetical protein
VAKRSAQTQLGAALPGGLLTPLTRPAGVRPFTVEFNGVRIAPPSANLQRTGLMR